MRSWIRTAGLLVLCLVPAALVAQDPPPPGAPGAASPPLRVFLDCPEYRCDPDFFRAEFPYADFVRSPQDADVQIIVTTVATGGGGGEYTLTVLGRGRFTGRADTLRTYMEGDATDDDLRKALAQRTGLALARYVALSPAADRFSLRYTAPDSLHTAVTQAVRDPWDYWAFRMSFNTFLNGEQSYRSSNLHSNFSANRITAALKVETELYWSTNSSTFEIDDSTSITSESKSYGTSLLIAPSLGPHWAWAGYLEASRSTYQNQALDLELLGGLEYDLWPYDQVTRRLLTFRLSGGVKHYEYDEVTLYGETAETHPMGSFETRLDVTQPWGSVGSRLEASTFLHDLEKHRVDLSGDIDVRLFRGFSLSMYGEISSIHDQLYLPAGGATDEEILLRRRQLATDYSYYTSVGFSYRFGSAFNNVVNPRFR